MGALKAPNAQAMLLGPAATASAPSPECTIKGDITRTRRRIYHMQNQKSYARIRMDKGGKRWFCTQRKPRLQGGTEHRGERLQVR